MNNSLKLPDCYAKDMKSNNYKLLELNHLDIEELKNDIQSVYEAMDINLAYGKTLDVLYGELLNQPRGLCDDTQYRYLLFLKLAKYRVQGNYQTIIDMMSWIFNLGQNEFLIDDENAPTCTVILRNFPLQGIVNSGFSSRQAMKTIEQLLPIGVSLQANEIEGTFEFGEFEVEYDVTKGFADLQQSVGGYLGLIIGEDETTSIFPIK